MFSSVNTRSISAKISCSGFVVVVSTLNRPHTACNGRFSSEFTALLGTGTSAKLLRFCRRMAMISFEDFSVIGFELVSSSAKALGACLPFSRLESCPSFRRLVVDFLKRPNNDLECCLGGTGDVETQDSVFVVVSLEITEGVSIFVELFIDTLNGAIDSSVIGNGCPLDIEVDFSSIENEFGGASIICAIVRLEVVVVVVVVVVRSLFRASLFIF